MQVALFTARKVDAFEELTWVSIVIFWLYFCTNKFVSPPKEKKPKKKIPNWWQLILGYLYVVSCIFHIMGWFENTTTRLRCIEKTVVHADLYLSLSGCIFLPGMFLWLRMDKIAKSYSLIWSSTWKFLLDYWIHDGLHQAVWCLEEKLVIVVVSSPFFFGFMWFWLLLTTMAFICTLSMFYWSNLHVWWVEIRAFDICI